MLKPSPSLEVLPRPPEGKSGWPWNQESPAPPAGDLPGISVVVPSYNQGLYLEETLRSLLLQNYPKLEVLVLDGGSQDESTFILKKYEPWLSFVRSQPDGGHAAAVNEGLALAQGEIFNFINSDDYLLPGSLQTVGAEIGGYDAVAGTNINTFSDGSYRHISCKDLSFASLISGRSRYQQQSIWLRTSLLKKMGGFDENYRHLFDLDGFLRFLTHSKLIQYVERPLAVFRIHEGSKSVRELNLVEWERTAMLTKLSQNDSPELSRICHRRLRQVAWWNKMERIRQDPHKTRVQKIVDLTLECIKDPAVRFNRMTLGSILRALTGHQSS